MNTKTTITGLVIVLVAIGVIYSITTREPAPSVSTDIEKYFEDRLITLGVADIGQPIEGFDAELLIRAFPGLITRDFEGVKTFEGYYTLEGDLLNFVRNQANPISSAERTVSSEGYAMLLTNVARRLAMSAVSTSDVDTIIARINTSETVETRIDQGASALGVRVVPLAVLEDSRCPVDVVCIQAGTVRVRTLLESGLGGGKQIFILNTPVTTETEMVTLVRVEPESRSTQPISPNDYRFFFEIKKR